MQTAEQIASLSKPIVIMCKDAVNASFENTLAQGMLCSVSFIIITIIIIIGI
jgi:hypothetical protein